MKSDIYIGFSSFEFQSNKSFKLTDIELVKMDLLNHIFTLKGERVMMRDFGTNIPKLIFEPITDELADQILNEVVGVINYDPRVDLLNIDTEILHDINTVKVKCILRYVEFDIVDNFELNIDFVN